MEGINNVNPLKDKDHTKKLVLYVNPRQYDRIIKRRLERDRLMDRRGKPKNTYVPIAIRELSMNLFKKDSFPTNFDKNNFLNNNSKNQKNNQKNVYPINPKINNGLIKSPQVHGTMYNNNNFYKGYLDNFNKGLKLDPSLCNKSLGIKNDSLSTNKLIKFNSQNSIPNTLYSLQHNNSFKCYNVKDPKMGNITKFEPISSNMEHYNTYETLLFNSPLTPVSTTIPNTFNQQANPNGMYNANNIGKKVNNNPPSVPIHPQNKTFQKSNDKLSSVRDIATPASVNSREEIKNNYLHLNGSPYSESSIDSEVVTKTEQIYNINQYGIVIDTNPDVTSGLSNPCSMDGNIDNIDSSIIDSSQDFSYMTNEDFLETYCDGMYGKAQFGLMFFGEQSNKTSSTVEDKDLIFGSISSTSRSSAHSIDVLGTE
ncbi:uncharacterized protein TA17930 [Theileria annulata]|uniref:Nuclear transcription factor Y subunit n=1 Tax=Theileria annulata TaxID=5874 RepID=Q4UB61_THEAN|nr:uncharacterized protein TA17930 [Theileria annulata]CAI75940.1 hypothetical protein TA17930 [Theileria annulata]|eukprot:XP_955416.1 hypothetical protein TA17930 [Theileria annulata]